MTAAQRDFLNEIETDLKSIILAYPVYGQHPYYDMIGKVYNKVKEHNHSPEMELKHCATTRFTPGVSGVCIHCGMGSGLHKYSTKRCPK
jgi:hypothetical protein